MELPVSNTSNVTAALGTEPLEPILQGTVASFVSASLICLLIIGALIANTFVCLAVYKQRSARRITRYFIINLCLADIFITVISMPIWLIFLLYDSKSAVLTLGETFVEIWRHVDIMCGTASILSLTSISVDRYIAVSRPYTYVQAITTRRAMHIIGGIWVYSMTVALLIKPLRKYKGGYAIFVMCASFLLPSLIIIAAYGSMFRVAMRHTRGLSRREEEESNHHHWHKEIKRHLKAAKTVAFVIGSFLCCWAPFIIVSVCFAFYTLDPTGASVTKWLAYLNAVLNPVVYTCVDKQLRRLVLKRLSFCFRGRLWMFFKEDRFAYGATENSSPMSYV
ncbi:dopamine receptor 2-like [Stylophora pistillata]|nr:dopamine receptor 2-like [Stylophora pistillata]XP_022788838.1 dopamine receptor 2-like [Stylophora pistillata]XP_022788839.1 dopamine receptor 2-like [Stylophora pistillata]